jgi:hypothetical protein
MRVVLCCCEKVMKLPWKTSVESSSDKALNGIDQSKITCREPLFLVETSQNYVSARSNLPLFSEDNEQ